jgi:drug/metabolite transporter (DMT)-like permease
MKLASELITPTQIVFFRVLFGFIPVLIYSGIIGALHLKHLKHSAHFLVMALLATTYYYGFAKGTSLLLSGIAGAVSGAIPLFSFLLAVFFIAEEKISKSKVLGIIIGFLGVVIIGRPTGQDIMTTNLEGVLYMVFGSLSVGASFVYALKYVIPLNITAAALTTYQLGIGLLILLFITDFNGISDIWTKWQASAGLIVGLGLLGTGLAYIIYYYIVEKLGAITASSTTYIPPVVALFIGAVLAGEPIEIADYTATFLIFAGVFLLKRN